MAETHELRLKIDAAAAKAGSREFAGAVEAIRRAVRDLERDASGAFTKLRKNIKDASSLGSIKVGVDKQAIRDLESFAAAHQQVTKSAAASEKSLKSVSNIVQGLSASYKSATMTADQFAASILRTNSALMKQIQLASQARSAVRQIRTAPTAMAEGTVTPVKRAATGGGNAEVAGLAARGAAKSVEASQTAIQRAIATSRTEVERLTVSLMKLGGFGAMSKLHSDLTAFTGAASRAGVSTKELAAAKDRFAAATANARTSLTTLTAKTQESARASAESARAEMAVERATKARASAQLSASAATRSAEAEAQRLSNRLKEMGDTRGISQVNSALTTLKASLSGGVRSAHEVRAAMDAFAQATARARAALGAHDASMRQARAEASALAQEKRRVADAARQVEREMRSIAGANNAVSKSFRDATGNMRGLENAFSATFQAGTLFRNMLGSLTFGTFVSGVYAAGNALDQFRVTMEVAAGSAAAGMEELSYIDSVANRLGVSLQSARDNYSKFAISASIAGVETAKTQRIFESVSTAMAVLGKGTEDQNLAFLALEQMMSKGTVSSEELRRQLGERLPGAVNMMAQALNVTTGELNDMLKAGEVSSADALPKFADVLMKRFGPGLEQAATRAGNNLQKLRNEIQIFQEEVAQSGFMQELAIQFRQLTQLLASGEGTTAARRLGEALANGARIGGEALQWLVENLETVGRVLKAIGIGIVVRQFALLGQAAATSAMQVGGYIASLMSGANGMSAADAAAVRHTAALEANTAAIMRNSAASTRGAATGAALASSHGVAARAAMASTGSIAANTAAMTAMGGAARGAAAGATLLSRGLSVIAPIAGIVVTAIMLIPGAMEGIGLEADGMSLKIEAALARSGAKFEDFGNSVRQNSAVGTMNGLLTDLQILESTIDNILSKTSGGLMSRMLGVSEIEALTIATGDANGALEGMDSVIADVVKRATGLSGDMLTGGAETAAQDLLRSFNMVKAGQMSAIELQNKIDDAILRFPASAPFFTRWGDLNKQLLQSEQGIVNTKQRLTELYGTSDEKLMQGFVKMAAQVYKTGEGMDGLKQTQQELAEANPQLASSLQKVMDSWDSSFQNGDSALQWSKNVESAYDGTARRIMAMREEVDRTSASFGTAIGDTRTRAAELAASLSELQVLKEPRMDGGVDFLGVIQPVPPEVLESYRGLVDQFLAFQSGDGLQVALEGLQMFTETLATGAPGVQQFTDSVLAQFSALSTSEQTYTRLDSIIQQTAAKFPQLGAEVAVVSAKMLEHARSGDKAAMAYSDLERAINALPWPTEEARNAALAVLDAANNTQQLGNAASAAQTPLYNAASGADSLGNSAWSAVGAIQAVMGALRSLFGMSGGITSGAMDLSANLKEQARIATLTGADKAIAQYWHSGEGAKFATESQAQIDGLKEQASSASSWVDKALLTGQAAIASATLAGAKSMVSADVAALYDANEASKGGGGKGGGGRGGASDAEKKSLEELNKTLKERLTSLEEERVLLGLVASGQFETAEGAQLMAQAMVAGGGAVDAQTAAMIRQVDAASKLNEELKKAARDPVKEWMDSVPSWVEAGKQIEMGAIDSLKTALSDFIKTGKLDMESLGEAILGTIADVVADKAMKELMTLLGRDDTGSGGWLGGLFGGLFKSQGDTELPGMGGDAAGMAAGSQQAGTTIATSMTTAGQQVAMDIQAAMTTGGTNAGTAVQGGIAAGATNVRTAATTGLAVGSNNIRMASVTGGAELGRGVVTGAQQGAPILSAAVAGGGGMGGGGGMFSFENILGMALGAFSEGGISTSPVGMATMPISSFRHAPHFSQGTSNTSGIPAVLHPNEAVIPLSKGRKIPVEMGDAGGGGSTTVVNQSFNIQTSDADSFRRSRKQIAADMASAGQSAVRQNR